MLRLEKSRIPLRSVAILIALGGLLIRGDNFHALPYYYSFMVLPVILFRNVTIQKKYVWYPISVCLLYSAIRMALIIPYDKRSIERRAIPETTDFSDLVRFVTSDEEKIIAYTFRNYEYIAADRLPSSAHFFYLPSQAKYNEDPILGIHSDPCVEIKASKPKVMLLDKWNIMGVYSWESYAQCIQEFAELEYIPIGDGTYYVRKDVYESVGIGTGLNPYDPILIRKILKNRVIREKGT